MNTRKQTLVSRLIGTFPVPPVALALIVAAVLVLPLLLVAYAPGQSAAVALQNPWRLAMAPALIAFILGVHPWLQSRWRLAIDALRPLSQQPDIVDQAFMPFRLGAWVALLLGAALAIWISESMPVAGWLFIYTLTTNVALFGLMALVIYDGLRRTRHLKRVVAAGLALDLFDRQLLTPLARFGQSVSLTFVGGICLSLLFQSATTLYSMQSLVIYSILVAVALILSFSSIWSIHVALVDAQERELAIVRQHWGRARDELRRHLAQTGSACSAEDAARLYDPLVVFGTYERQVLEASTWPFNPKIVKQVAASMVAPILIYGIKVAAGLSGQALP
ncbi:MAG TPA: hypothetical protein VFU71_19220 [Burkholderiaceae bacterium]|nr:hypothetical protein [Burkholderiaceae bacterium]